MCTSYGGSAFDGYLVGTVSRCIIGKRKYSFHRLDGNNLPELII